ncbi:probable G-protein coupled receptor B0563.6 [Haliotis rufescens]|uniref:probable G-protein coupled receptor B0563.6 n=1 Tax=Haliotis rufescens TaxID=6454 RepID=UPI00201E9106|nr:probable G-protein coupled receptor B0563.6 [Haliotis rufescens]
MENLENATIKMSTFLNHIPDKLQLSNFTTTTQKSIHPAGYFVIPAEDMVNFRIAMYTTIMPVTALIGIVGNVISFVVLLRHKMRDTTKMVLISITVCDFLHLIAMILFCLIGVTIALDYKPGLYISRKAFPYFGSYLRSAFGRISNLLIVVISLERLCAVLFPLKIKSLWSRKTMGLSIFICSLLVAAILVPYALEFVPTDFPIPNSTQMTTVLKMSEFGKNRDFYATLYIVRLFLLRFIPIAVVIICNITISVSLYRSKSARSQMTGQNRDETPAEQRITQTLFGLALLFFFCMTPGALNILSQLFDYEYNFPKTRNNVYNLVGILAAWLEIVNSSANFIIYIISSRQMRMEFKRIIMYRKGTFSDQKYITDTSASEMRLSTMSVSAVS